MMEVGVENYGKKGILTGLECHDGKVMSNFMVNPFSILLNLVFGFLYMMKDTNRVLYEFLNTGASPSVRIIILTCPIWSIMSKSGVLLVYI